MNNKLGHGLAIITVFIWGITFIATKIVLEELDPAEILFYRFIMAYILLLILHPKQIRFTDVKTELIFLGLGLSGVTLYFLAENMALQYTLASNVSLILSSVPILTALFAHVLTHDEKLKSSFVLGFIVAFLGMVLVIFNGHVLKLKPLGDLLALLAAVTWGIYSILLKKIKKMHPDFKSIYIVRKTFFYGVLLCIPVLLGLSCDLKPTTSLNVSFLGNILFLGIIASALCYVLWNQSVNLIGVIKASHYIYFIPVITMVASAIVLRETINLLMVGGCGLILSGVYISERA